MNTDDPQSNWNEALECWSRIANWVHYSQDDGTLRREIQSLILLLWNEKDWLKAEYDVKGTAIEAYVNQSQYIKIVADLANTLKHRKLNRPPRSTATSTNFNGTVSVGSTARRTLHFIADGQGGHAEILTILRCALDEFEDLRQALLNGSL